MAAEELRRRFGGQVKEGEPLAAHVHFRLGGPADFYVEARSSGELASAVEAALIDGLPFAILGGGSNTLPSDGGFRGLVIQAANRNWSIEGETAVAEAGVLSAFLARKTAEAGLSGFEWAISLPGTIGGAVRGNAGCFGGETKDALHYVDVLCVEGGKVARARRENPECAFGYRDSVFKRNGEIVLSAAFRLRPAPKEECLARVEATLAKRKAEQPNDRASAGCMFKNFEYKEDADIARLQERADVPAEFLARRRIPAGWLIDQADLKGTRIGQAAVSDKHGNFLMNLGGASASDIVQLISLVKMKVRDLYGLQLEEEVQLLGF